MWHVCFCCNVGWLYYNQTPHSVDWSSEGLLAYGAGNSVALARKGEVSTYTSSDDIHIDNLSDKVIPLEWFVSCTACKHFSPATSVQNSDCIFTCNICYNNSNSDSKKKIISEM